MKKLSILFTLMFTTVLGIRAQIVSTESFDNNTFVPAGWALKPVMNQNPWIRATNGTAPTTTPHSGAGMARFRSSSINVASGTQQILVSRMIDYTSRGTQAANLSFWMYRDDTSPTYDSIRLYVSSSDTIDATTTYITTLVRNRTYAMPDTQATNGWYQYTFSIPATYTNNTTTRFLWQGTSEYTTTASANMFIDDISFDEFPNACSGTPNVGSIVSLLPMICGGSGTTVLSLTSPITGVTGLTYTWESSASGSGPWTSFGTNSSTATTATLSATTYFRCTVYCAVSASTYTTPIDSVVVSTNPLPTIAISPNPAPYCAGSTGVSITASGGVSYSWSPATGLNTSTGATVIASPSAATQYTVLGMDSLGCSDTAMVNVPIVNAPTVTMTANPNDSVCSGATVILNCLQTNQPGFTFLWSDGKTTRRDTTVISATTTYSVVVTNNAGCTATGSIVVTALPAQNSGFSYTVNGNTFTFTDTTTGATDWIWSFGDGNGSTSQNPVYTYSQTGNYTVTLIVTGACKTDTVTIPIAVYPLSVSDLNQSGKSLFCYPNPANELINVQSTEALQDLEIYNMHGQKVKTLLIENKNNAAMNIHDLPQGLYHLRAHSMKGFESITFMKN